ncbi:MAG: DapH/DapD/GlmU-related protein [Solirubrobacteraceae bacterium]
MAFDVVGGAYVASEAVLAAGVELAPGAVIHRHARIGAAVTIGAGAVVHAGTEVGERCVIEDGAVLGKRPRLRPGSRAEGAALGPLVLAAEVTVCCGAIVYAGSVIGGGAIIGDQAEVRERSSIGPRTVVGRGSTVDFDTRVGARVSIQTGVYLTAKSIVEDDVFLAPGVLTTNDNTMARHSREDPLRGAVLRRACRIGAGAVLVPGVVIGEEALIGAGAVVTGDIGAREVAIGVPARAVRRVADEDLLERWR